MHLPTPSIERLLASLVLVSAGAALQAADAPGLVAEFFKDTTTYPDELKPGTKPFLVRVDARVNVGASAGQFSKTKLAENFTARWTGVVTAAKAGTYEFATESDDGSRLSIDGKLVVDNGGTHAMARKAGTVELGAGPHQLKLEYIQGGGESGCKLLWTPPAGKEEAIPANVLSHAPGTEKIPFDEVAWKKTAGGAGGGKYALMDHGPFYAGTIVQPNGVCSNKGLIVTLDKAKGVRVVFDTELLRVTYGAVDSIINYPAGRDGIEGQPEVVSDQVVFAAASGLGSAGWAKPGSSDFADPRTKHLGNLPADWARYRGLYLSGDTTVLSYTVGGAEILEVPGVERAGAVDAITRTLTLARNSAALTALLAEGAKAEVANGVGVIDEDGAVTAVGVVGGGGTIAAVEGRLVLNVPAGTALAKVALWKGERAALPAFTAFLAAAAKPASALPLTKGGPGRSKETVSAPGELGKGDGPYVVDTIPVPYENPYKSYMRLTGHDFFKDGTRAAVTTMDGDVWIVSGIDAGLANVTWKRFATGLFQSLGVRIVDDTVYVTCRDRLVRLHDLDGDGEADFYESFNADAPVTKHYHEFCTDLETDKEGNFIFTKGSNLGAGFTDATSEVQGCVLKVSKDGKTMTRYATGLREPNGLGGGDGYPLLTSDNQGNWTPVDRINLVKEGGFYGFMGTAHRDTQPTTYDPPLLWTPYNLDNSPGGLAYVNNDQWGPFKGMPIGFSYGKCSMFAVLPEEVEGTPQAAMVFFPMSFASGTMRARFGADHALYVSGMRGWQTSASHDGNFQRIRYTGKPVTMPTSFHVTPTGVTIGFDQALDPATAADAGNYAIERWNYRYTSNYGSKDYKVTDPAKEGHDKVEASAAVLSADKKSVTLTIPGIAPVMQMSIEMRIESAAHAPIEYKVFDTINKVPGK